MDNKTRIEKEALDYAKAMISAPDDIRMFKYTIEDYIAGATAEQERFKSYIEESLKALKSIHENYSYFDKRVHDDSITLVEIALEKYKLIDSNLKIANR